MKPALFTHVNFPTYGDLQTFLASQELTAVEIRAELIRRLAAGERLLAVTSDNAPVALVQSSPPGAIAILQIEWAR